MIGLRRLPPALALLAAATAAGPAGVAAVPQDAGPRLLEARVEVDRGAQGARVTARYRFRDPPDVLELNAVRLRGQTVELVGLAADGRPVDVRRARQRGERPDPGGALLRRLPGLHRLRIRDRNGGAESVRLRYRVAGPLRRVPLFVPETPTLPPESRIRISLTDPPDGLRPERAFPRLEPAGDGSLEARPDNLPSFLMLPRTGSALPVGRTADWVVILLVVGGTGYWWWWWRRRRLRREAEDVGGGGSPGTETRG